MKNNNNNNYTNNIITNQINDTNISLYNKKNNLNARLLSLGTDKKDFLNTFIYCVFKEVNPNNWNAFTYLSKCAPSKEDLQQLNLVADHKQIVIVSLYPEFLSIWESEVDAHNNILCISLFNFMDNIPILRRIVEERGESVLFIFHSLRWYHIISIFMLENINIYGVKSSIRHSSTSLHISLFDFLFSLFGSFKRINDNLIREPIFSKYWGLSRKPITDININVLHPLTVEGVFGENSDSGNDWVIKYIDLKYTHLKLLKLRVYFDNLSVELSNISLEIKSLEDNITKSAQDLSNRIASLTGQIVVLEARRHNVNSKISKYKGYIESEKAKNQIKISGFKSQINTLFLREKAITQELDGSSVILSNHLNIYNEAKAIFINYINNEYLEKLTVNTKEMASKYLNATDDLDYKVINNETSSITSPYVSKHMKLNSLKNKAIKNNNRNNIRKYSTSRDAYINKDVSMEYSIENTLYASIYPYIIDACLPENSSNLDKMVNIQLDIENLLYNQGQTLLEVQKGREMNLNPNLLTVEVKNIILSQISDLDTLIANLKTEFTYEVNPKLKTLKIKSDTRNTSRKILIEILSIVSEDKELRNIVLARLLKIISNYNFVNENSTSTTLYIDTGKALFNLFVEILYNRTTKKITNSNKPDYYIINNINTINNQIYTSFNDFKLNSPYASYFEIFSKTNHLLHIGAWLLEKLIECNIIREEVISTDNKNKLHLLRPSESLENLLNKHPRDANFLDLPSKLPMLVKPNEYSPSDNNNLSKAKLGGYLLNDKKYELPIIIQNPNLRNPSKILAVNSVYSLINNSSQVPFKINTQLLDFILKENHRFNFILEPQIKHPLADALKLTSQDKEDITKFNSEKLSLGHIMRIAIIYRNVNKFYIPVRIDNRGRLYALTNYLHYQGSELAKSLLLFSESAKIYKTDDKALMYFKSYGANLYGHGLDKLNYPDKLNWILENESDILNYNNGVLLAKAEKKLLFLAFCIEYCNYSNSLNNNLEYYYSDFPIQVDATCNGFQHLALLLGDNALAEQLNLKDTNYFNKPKDFYSFISISLKDLFQEKLVHMELNPGSENSYQENYERLYNLEIHRSLIKKPIMTKPYNVSMTSMQDYILNEFNIEEGSKNRAFLKKEEGRGEIWYRYKKDASIRLTETDILLIALSIDYLIYKKFPNLLKLTEYFKDVAKFCNALKISIPWILPSGLEVNQEYLDSKTLKLKPFTHKNDTYNIKLPDTQKIHNLKQIRALMPNIIHSLDSASLALIIEILSKNTDKFYSVHDCFATTPNNIDKLITDIRMVYYSIYSKEQNLLMFDAYLKEHISKLVKWEYPQVLTINKKIYKFPDITEIISTRDFDYRQLLSSQPVI